MLTYRLEFVFFLKSMKLVTLKNYKQLFHAKGYCTIRGISYPKVLHFLQSLNKDYIFDINDALKVEKSNNKTLCAQNYTRNVSIKTNIYKSVVQVIFKFRIFNQCKVRKCKNPTLLFKRFLQGRIEPL